mgnify:FL=1
MRRLHPQQDGVSIRPKGKVAGRPKRRRTAEGYEYAAWRVTDNWPDDIPVTKAEVDLFEAYFGDLFDEMFGGRP